MDLFSKHETNLLIESTTHNFRFQVYKVLLNINQNKVSKVPQTIERARESKIIELIFETN